MNKNFGRMKNHSNEWYNCLVLPPLAIPFCHAPLQKAGFHT